MAPILGPDGLAAVGGLLRGTPLLAFDFDGTLAPIVARPQSARVPPAVARRLDRLARHLPVAIVTGRSVADVSARLGFEPRFVVGSHGAEDVQSAEMQQARRAALEGVRRQLQVHAATLAEHGVAVEDKGLSLALHYRCARDREAAREAIERLLKPGDPQLRIFGGKMVVNVMAADAPDKADAVRALLARTGADRAFFAGDDVNDEAVFEAAPPDWVTVRVGLDAPLSRARFFLGAATEMPLLLDHMLAELEVPPGA
jgi:trehalose 6-phosphate phosphatase